LLVDVCRQVVMAELRIGDRGKKGFARKSLIDIGAKGFVATRSQKRRMWKRTSWSLGQEEVESGNEIAVVREEKAHVSTLARKAQDIVAFALDAEPSGRSRPRAHCLKPPSVAHESRSGR
jgi:hypothetical protein